MKISGYVLAGARSSRMGRDKALMNVPGLNLPSLNMPGSNVPSLSGAGRPAIQRQCELLNQLCPDGVFVAGSNSPEVASLAWPIISDPTPFEGPLSGIVSALHHAREGIALIIAVDLWDLDYTDLSRILQVSLDPLNEFDVVYARASRPEQGSYKTSARETSKQATSNLNDRPVDQPLCAAWRVTSSTSSLERAFTKGERSIMKAWTPLSRSAVDIPSSHLANYNTPADLHPNS